MKPVALVTGRVCSEAAEMLASVCDVVLLREARAGQALPAVMRHATALMAVTPECIDAATLAECRRLRIIACAFRIPEHIDIATCTRNGVWVTTVMTRALGKAAEIEAARNILDVLSGDMPRGALNDVLETAA